MIPRTSPLLKKAESLRKVEEKAGPELAAKTISTEVDEEVTLTEIQINNNKTSAFDRLGFIEKELIEKNLKAKCKPEELKQVEINIRGKAQYVLAVDMAIFQQTATSKDLTPRMIKESVDDLLKLLSAESNAILKITLKDLNEDTRYSTIRAFAKWIFNAEARDKETRNKQTQENIKKRAIAMGGSDDDWGDLPGYSSSSEDDEKVQTKDNSKEPIQSDETGKILATETNEKDSVEQNPKVAAITNGSGEVQEKKSFANLQSIVSNKIGPKSTPAKDSSGKEIKRLETERAGFGDLKIILAKRSQKINITNNQEEVGKGEVEVGQQNPMNAVAVDPTASLSLTETSTPVPVQKQNNQDPPSVLGDPQNPIISSSSGRPPPEIPPRSEKANKVASAVAQKTRTKGGDFYINSLDKLLTPTLITTFLEERKSELRNLGIEPQNDSRLFLAEMVCVYDRVDKLVKTYLEKKSLGKQYEQNCAFLVTDLFKAPRPNSQTFSLYQLFNEYVDPHFYIDTPFEEIFVLQSSRLHPRDKDSVNLVLFQLMMDKNPASTLLILPQNQLRLDNPVFRENIMLAFYLEYLNTTMPPPISRIPAEASDGPNNALLKGFTKELFLTWYFTQLETNLHPIVKQLTKLRGIFNDALKNVQYDNTVNSIQYDNPVNLKDQDQTGKEIEEAPADSSDRANEQETESIPEEKNEEEESSQTVSTESDETKFKRLLKYPRIDTESGFKDSLSRLFESESENDTFAQTYLNSWYMNLYLSFTYKTDKFLYDIMEKFFGKSPETDQNRYFIGAINLLTKALKRNESRRKDLLQLIEETPLEQAQ